MSNAFSFRMAAVAAGLATLLSMGTALADASSKNDSADQTRVCTVAGLPPDWTLDPINGMFTAPLNFGEDRVEVLAGGTSRIPGGNPGFVGQAPDYRFVLSAPVAHLQIYMTPGSPDTVLLVNDAEGTWRYDSSWSPTIDIYNAPAGAYDIFAGTFDCGTLESATVHIVQL